MSVYKIVDKTSGELIYIGQTKELSQRIEWHHINCKNMQESNLYKHIRQNGGWENMEFIELASELDIRKRLLLENTFQLELHPLFYWICNRIHAPMKIIGFNPSRIRTDRRNQKAKNMPGKTLEMPELG
jgi:excinuclease UvrABC nuclease subunit